MNKLFLKKIAEEIEKFIAKIQIELNTGSINNKITIHSIFIDIEKYPPEFKVGNYEIPFVYNNSVSGRGKGVPLKFPLKEYTLKDIIKMLSKEWMMILGKDFPSDMYPSIRFPPVKRKFLGDLYRKNSFSFYYWGEDRNKLEFQIRFIYFPNNLKNSFISFNVFPEQVYHNLWRKEKSCCS